MNKIDCSFLSQSFTKFRGYKQRKQNNDHHRNFSFNDEMIEQSSIWTKSLLNEAPQALNLFFPDLNFRVASYDSLSGTAFRNSSSTPESSIHWIYSPRSLPRTPDVSYTDGGHQPTMQRNKVVGLV